MDSTSIALNLPKVLKRILSFLPNKDLLTARFVCAFWRDQAFWLFNAHNIPTIVAGKGFIGEEKQIPLNRFLAELKNVKGLPLTIRINEWTQEVISFLQTYSSSIVEVILVINRLPDFTLDNNKFHLPKLTSCVFCLDISGAYGNYENEMIQDAFQLWEEVLSGAEEPINYCQMDLIVRKRTMMQVFPLVMRVPRQLKYLTLRVEDNNTSFYFNPAIEFQKREDDPCQNQLIFYNVDNLKEIGLQVRPEPCVNLNFGLVSGLKGIKTKGKCQLGSADGTTPLAKLIPNLEKLVFCPLPTSDSIGLTNLGNAPFESLKSLHYTVKGCGLEKSMECARQIKLFPNLTELGGNWASVDIATSVLHYLASHLTNLKALNVGVAEIKEDDDLVKMLTGLGKDEIPQDENQWSQILDGKTNAICNLPNLEKFFIINEGETYLMKEFKFLMNAFGSKERTETSKLEITVANIKDAYFKEDSGKFSFDFPEKVVKGSWQKLNP